MAEETDGINDRKALTNGTFPLIDPQIVWNTMQREKQSFGWNQFKLVSLVPLTFYSGTNILTFPFSYLAWKTKNLA